MVLLLSIAVTVKGQYQVPEYVQNYDSDKPTVYAVDLGGGYQQVADSTAKADLSFYKRVVGMMVTYNNGADWITERYDGVDTTTVNWVDPDNWSNVGTAVKTVIGEQEISYNTDDYTLNIPTGLGPVLQVGQERFTIVYNNTSDTLFNGTVVYPVGQVSGRPSVEKAIANTHETIQFPLSVLTMDIPPASEGISTGFGYVRNYNTSTFSLGQPIYLSESDSGLLVVSKPEFPDYPVLIGGVTKLGTTDGEIFVRIGGDEPENTVVNFWNGVFRETFDFRVTESGGTVTGTLTPSNGHEDMTMIFSDGFTMLDTDPGATITLTPGTDTNPATNYVYIPESTKVLTVSTSDWPTAEHIKVAQILLQSATTTGTNGALRNQNWNDAIENTSTFQGHLSHIGEKIRQFESQWNSGTEGSIDAAGLPTNVYIDVTQGTVYQMHKQTFPAQTMSSGDDIHVVNDPVTPYRITANLNDLTVDANNSSINNRWTPVVVWGVINKTGEESHIMLNLPLGSYTSESSAVSDALNYAVYDIPKEFQGVGFLIARFVIRKSGTSFTYNSGVGYLDLRGKIPNTTAGAGSGSSGITTFLGLTDTEASYTPYEFQIANAGGTALESPSDLVYTSTGLGVGETSPSYKLVVDAAGVNEVARLLSTDNNAFFSIRDDDTETYFGAQDDKSYFGRNATLSSDNLIIQDNGYVGIGTTSPTHKFSLVDGRASIRETTDTDYAVLYFGNDISATEAGFFLAGSNATAYGGARSVNLINLDSYPLTLGTNGAVDFFIQSGGNVGINDLTPSYKLDVNGTGRFTGIVNFDVFPVTPSSAPTTDYQVANKKYVDDNAGGGVVFNGSTHGTVSENDLFDAMKGDIPNTNDEMVVSGGLETASATYIVARAVRTSSTAITLYVLTDLGVATTYVVNDGDTTTRVQSLAW